MKNSITVYKVTFRNWGADKEQASYFKTLEKANEFYNSRDYIDKPEKARISEEQLRKLNEIGECL